MTSRHSLSIKEDMQRQKVKVEVGLFKQWWLKNVEIHDKSNPDFTPNVLKVIHDEIRKYDATNLNHTKMAARTATLDFVTNLLTSEITSYGSKIYVLAET